MDRAAGVTLGRPFCIADKDIDVGVSLKDSVNILPAC